MLIASSVGCLFSQPFGWLHYVLWTATVVSIPVSIAGLRSPKGGYLGMKELEQARQPLLAERERETV
jgi:hypothetical protein